MALPIGTLLPSLEGATEWINGDIASAANPHGPLLVQFWSMSCPACKRGMPRVMAFLSTYSDHGLRLLSIHMPRGVSDLDAEKVKVVVAELGITGTCAVDNNHVLGRAFETAKTWPSYFLFDGSGRLRSRAAGRLGLNMAENSLIRILRDGEGEATPQQDNAYFTP